MPPSAAFAAAVDWCERMGAPTFLARTQGEWAAMRARGKT
jgi:hypothetical protein